MQRFLHLWCEWDYGQDDYIFSSEEKGRDWLWNAMLSIDGADYIKEQFGWSSVNDIFEEGLAGFKIVTLDP